MIQASNLYQFIHMILGPGEARRLTLTAGVEWKQPEDIKDHSKTPRGGPKGTRRIAENLLNSIPKTFPQKN